MNETKFDLIIIGSGPAGMTASIYAARAGMKVLVIDKKAPGGKLLNTKRIDNWPGQAEVSGFELATSMQKQAKSFGVEFAFGEVVEIKKKDDFLIISKSKTYIAKYVLIATGMKNRKLNIPGEKEFEHKGVSYCLVCDGAFFNNQDIVVIGGGNSALEEALFASSNLNKITIIQNIDKLTAEKITIDNVKKTSNIEIMLNTTIKKIEGNDFVENIVIEKNGKEEIIQTKAVFVYVGYIPNTDFLETNILNDYGFITVDKYNQTKTQNLFAAGDVIDKQTRQITTAVGDATIAAIEIINRFNN